MSHRPSGKDIPSVSHDPGHTENPSRKWVPTLRKPRRREVLAATCGSGLWKLMDLFALKPELAMAITATAVLLVLFVGLDPWPGSDDSRPLPPSPQHR